MKTRTVKKAEKAGTVVEEEKKGGEDDNSKQKSMRIRCALTNVPTVCGTCDSRLTIGGPIWNQPIHKVNFAKRLLARAEKEDCSLKTVGRIKGILGGIIDEEPLQEFPLSFSVHDVCSTIRAQNPRKEQVHAAFKSLNFRLCQTYYNGDLWKTDAPPEAVYDIFKKWKSE